ncbi:hypothetical protein Q8A67_020052 [Cirrhinus molitorella]|uniref:Uncharacterized protein n=1 Tax=Cirrhinus molitorella TaxID=172907 RepID=A0AA88PDI4_9TELE|nr:hypothetical protein Q8A67_020052 [Cirrhinus molitorella]
MMPHKSKKDKSVRSSRRGSKQHEVDQDSENENKSAGSRKPPNTQLLRSKQPSGQSALKKHRRLSASCFPISLNRELLPLDALTVMRRDALYAPQEGPLSPTPFLAPTNRLAPLRAVC